MLETYDQGKTLGVSMSNSSGESSSGSALLPVIGEPRVVLTDRERSVLTFIGQGLTTKEISDYMSIAPPYVQLILRKIKMDFGAQTPMGALISAMDQGAINAAEIVPLDFDPEIFLNLTPNQRTALGAYFDSGDSTKEGKIAISLDFTPEYFSGELDEAVQGVGARNRTQAAVFLYRAREIIQLEDGGSKELKGAMRGMELGIRGKLSEREKETLLLRGQGLTNNEVAEEMGINLHTVKHHVFNAMKKLHSDTCSNAILKAVDIGLIDLSPSIPLDFDPNTFKTLSFREAEVFLLIINQGSTNKEIAYELGISEQTVKNHMSSIKTKIGLVHREQFIGVYIEAKRIAREEAIAKGEDPEGIEIFAKPISGEETGEVAPKEVSLSKREIESLWHAAHSFGARETTKRMGVTVQTVKNFNYQIMKKLDSVSITQAAMRAIERGDLNLPDLVPRRFNPVILSSLVPVQVKILEMMIDFEGTLTNKELASNLRIAQQTIKNQFTEILSKLGAKGRTQALVFFKEARRREQAAHALSDREKQALSLIAQGYKGKTIAEQMGIPETTLKYVLSSARKRLGVDNSVQAIARALDQGQLNTEDLVPENFDPNSFGDLSDTEAKILLRFIATGDAESNAKIAETLGLPKAIVDKSLPEILYQLGAKNRAQALVYILESIRQGFVLEMGDPEYFSKPRIKGEIKVKNEQNTPYLNEPDVIALLVRGFEVPEISRRLNVPESSVKITISRARRKWGSSEIGILLIRAVKSGELDASSVVDKNLNEKAFNRLNATEKYFIQKMIDKEELRDRELSELLLMDASVLRRYIKGILEKLGVKSKAEVIAIYLEAQKREREKEAERKAKADAARFSNLRGSGIESITIYVSED